MRKLILLCTSLCAMAVLISASPVRAQAFVSMGGSDANDCSRNIPCGSFQGVLNKYPHAAVIICLNRGEYGAFTVTASVIIDCGTSNVGVVQAFNGTAITINTPASATVVLRGLSLIGLGQSPTGIDASAFVSGTLIIEDCVIQGFNTPGTGAGIFFAPSGGRGSLDVSNSRIFGNAYGISVQPTNGQIASVTLNRVELNSNKFRGLEMNGSGVVAGTMRDSVASSNGSTGVFVNASQVYFTIEQSSIINNLAQGIYTLTPGSIVNVGDSTIGGNGTGVRADAGQLISFGDNRISANGTDGNFTSTKALR